MSVKTLAFSLSLCLAMLCPTWGILACKAKRIEYIEPPEHVDV